MPQDRQFLQILGGEAGCRLIAEDFYARVAMSERPSITAEDLERWTDNGAQWRPLEVSDDRAVVELCTCYGEPVDVVQGQTAALIAYVRDHADDSRSELS